MINELEDRLKLFNYYKISSSEKRYLGFLKNNSSNKEYLSVLKWYMDDYIYEELSNIFYYKQYEWARYRAQIYINCSYSLPPDEYFNNASWKLSKAREAIEYVDGVFPYDNRFVKDKIEYRSIANKFEYSSDPAQVFHWENFIKQNPHSLRIDEARFNIINYHLSNMRSKDDRKHVLKLLIEFIISNESSYLSDDAIWYAIQLSIELDKYKNIQELFTKLTTKYKNRDHSKRLKYNLISWLRREHLVPKEVSEKVISFIFSLPNYPDNSLVNMLSGQFPSKTEREEVLNTISFLLRQHSMINHNHTIEIGKVNSKEAIIGVLSLWVNGK